MDVYCLAESLIGVPVEDDWLGEAERAALARLRVPKRRADWRLGRWTAKRAIAARLSLDPFALAAIEIRRASSGAPEPFVDGRPAGLSLSISHSHGTGFCAVADAGAELGCDVERVATRGAAVLEDYFTTDEQETVARAEADERENLVTVLWSAKESALKALKCGLRADTRSVAAALFAVSRCGGGEWRRLAARHEADRTFHGWWRLDAEFVWTVVGVPPPAMPLSLDDSGYTGPKLPWPQQP